MTTTITIVGNLAADPEHGISDAGSPWTRIRVITNDRYRDRTGEWQTGPATSYRVTCFRRLAENTANSLTTGDPVVVTGTLTISDYRDTDGNTRISRDIIATHIGADLSRATVAITRNPRRDNNTDADPWADTDPAANNPQD